MMESYGILFSPLHGGKRTVFPDLKPSGRALRRTLASMICVPWRMEFLWTRVWPVPEKCKGWKADWRWMQSEKQLHPHKSPEFSLVKEKKVGGEWERTCWPRDIWKMLCLRRLLGGMVRPSLWRWTTLSQSQREHHHCTIRQASLVPEKHRWEIVHTESPQTGRHSVHRTKFQESAFCRMQSHTPLSGWAHHYVLAKM